jgi:two-component system LytT family response regulator
MGKKSNVTCVIVDDEDLAREALKIELAQFEAFEVAGECQNGFEAVKMIQELKPDLVFLDIQMPRLDGFDVIELLGERVPAVVFVTAHDEYAVKAFEANAVDYLLKPVQSNRLQRTLEKFIKDFPVKKSIQHQKELLESHQDYLSPISRILIRNGMDIQIIPVMEVSHLEAQDDYVKVFTDKKSYLKTERLNRLEGLLDPRHFCRIHRSHILNVNYLKKIEPYSKDSRIAVLKDGTTLPISRTGYSQLKTIL